MSALVEGKLIKRNDIVNKKIFFTASLLTLFSCVSLNPIFAMNKAGDEDVNKSSVSLRKSKHQLKKQKNKPKKRREGIKKQNKKS
jgi:hypothetical protein